MLDLRPDTWPARHVESTCPKKQQIPSRQCRGQSRPRLELFPGNDDNVVKIFFVRRQTLKNLRPIYILLPDQYLPSTMVITTRTIEISGVLFFLDYYIKYYFEDEKLIEEVVDH